MKRNVIILISVILAVLLVLFFVFSLSGKKVSSGLKESSDVPSVSELFDIAGLAQNKGDLLQAKEAYQRIISIASDNKIITKAGEELYDLNIRIIFSTLQTEKTIIYEVKPGDVLSKIAKKFNTTVALIKRSNNLKSNVIRPEQRLRIWTEKFSCIVDKSQNTLTLKSDDEVVKVYTVSTGKHNSTPVGIFTITSKLIDPVWYKQGAIVLPDSPENILGSRWLGFSIAGYGIHGTTEPETIGQQITAGCVRMVNQQVEELFDLLPLGTEVTVID
ncbi:MAG: L,D-transpeptidase family protein [Candidatus Omnitrophica bacterium]|nr:L,D-transpeptidase family protein [Candidatus Omnitrophota bacterium]